MTIKELLKQYFATPETNPGWPAAFWEKEGHGILSSKLRNDLKNNKGMMVFYSLLLARKTNFTAQDICDFCDDLNIKTDTEILDFISRLENACQNVNKDMVCDTITGNRNLDILLQPMSYDDLESKIKAQFPNLTNYEIRDLNMQVTDKAGLTEICNCNPASGYSYQTDTRDCEDTSDIFKAWLSEQNIGNITIAYCEVNAYKGQTLAYAHAINLALISEDEKFMWYFIEPQNGSFSKVDGFDPPGMTADRYEVRKLMF